jgi:hypothetical protein
MKNTTQETPKEEDSIRESIIAKNLMKKLKKGKVRIKRLIKKSDGNLTLKDTTLSESQHPLPNSMVDDSLFSQVDYKFTRQKNAHSFEPGSHFDAHKFQSATPMEFPGDQDPFLQRGGFKKKKNQEVQQTTSEKVVTTDRVETFTQMIEKDIRQSIENRQKIDPIPEKQSELSHITQPSITEMTHLSRESTLFTLPKKVNEFMGQTQEFKGSIKERIEDQKKLALEKLEFFKSKLMSCIESRLDVYRKALTQEFDSYYQDCERDVEYVGQKCKEFNEIPRKEIDINRPKIKFENFEYFVEGTDNVLKSEVVEIMTFPENENVVARNKELSFLVETLEKKVVHIPGFAGTETTNTCMQDTVSNLDQFCETNFRFLDNALYKTEQTPLENIQMRYKKVETEVTSSRKSLRRFKGEEEEETVHVSQQEPDPENKEIHNIWKNSIERHRDRESRGVKDEETEQELMKRKEMLKSMKEFDEQVKQYQEQIVKEEEEGKGEEKRKEEGEEEGHTGTFGKEPESDFKIDYQHNEDVKAEHESLGMNSEADSIPSGNTSLTREQQMLLEENREKHELFLKKQKELRNSVRAKSTYEKMSVFSMREEHLEGDVNKETLAQKNAETLNNLMRNNPDHQQNLENLLDSNQFEGGEKTPDQGNAEPPEVKSEANQESKLKAQEVVRQLMKQQEEELQKKKVDKVLNLEFKRSNISIEKIVKGKSLNGVSQAGDKLFFFGDEFIFKCTLTFQDPVMYKLGGKDLTFLRNVEKEVGPDHYLLGITNKDKDSSEVLLIRLTNQFSLLKRVTVEETQASGVINIFNLDGKKQFICVTRFGIVQLFDYSEPMIVKNSEENLNGERIETAIMTARQSSICLVSQNSQIIGIEISFDSETGKAAKVSKSRIMPIQNQANDIVKISEDQVGYCDEEGMFSLLTFPMEINGNKLGIKKTRVCEFPVDKLFVLESTPNKDLDFRNDIKQLLMINYEGHVAVFDFRNRKKQVHFDAKLVQDICLHSQNALLSERSESRADVLLLSTSTLKKLIIQKEPKNN